jgi:hypothetical protein
LQEYRGELMPGVYVEWVLDERERLRRECVELCDLSIGVERKSCDPRSAGQIARRLEETGYRTLMQLQLEPGDVAAAMASGLVPRRSRSSSGCSALPAIGRAHPRSGQSPPDPLMPMEPVSSAGIVRSSS